jgi:hypothetical protein
MTTRKIHSLLVLAILLASPASGRDSLYVQLAGDSLAIWDVHAVENCASRFVSSLALSQDTLTWVQTDTVGPIARCICTYDMTVSMTGLPSGTYIARLFRDRQKQYHYTRDTLEFVGEITFSNNTSAQQFTARAFYQSGCLGTAIVQENIVPVPVRIALGNYPNPFNPGTVVSYQLPASGRVRLVVYDMLGRDVAVLMDGEKPAGIYTAPFDGSGLSSGVYFCRLYVEPERGEADAEMIHHGVTTILTTKMVLVR